MAGHRDRAQGRLDEARTVLARQHNPLPEQEAGCLIAAAGVAGADDRLNDAVAFSERALSRLSASGLERHAMVGAALSRLSEYHDSLGDARKAHAYNHESLQAYVRRGYGGTMQALVLMLNETADLYNFGELKRALAVANQLADIMTTRGMADADRAPYLVNHASILWALGRNEQALSMVDRAQAVSQTSGNQFWQQRALFVRAQLLIRLDEHAAAKRALDEVEATYRADPVRNKSSLASVALARAEWLQRTGQSASARQMVDGLIANLRRESATPSHGLRRALLSAAELALAESDPSAAATWAEAAVEANTAAALDPTRSAHVGQAQLLLARAQRDLGQAEQAALTLAAAITALGNGLGDEHERVAAARAMRVAWQRPAPASRPGR